jgi:hypothetical protein
VGEGESGKGKKQFFFEKKNQKTFENRPEPSAIPA